MTQKYVTFGQLVLPNGVNPRRNVGKAGIKGLAESIKEDGVLQNLVVEPNCDDTYHVLTGKRRYLALKLLKRQGAIDDGYKVPVTVKRELSEDDARRIATVENVQREALDPIDEADAFASLLRDGVSLEDISAKTGVSRDVIRRRLALANLAASAKDAFRKAEISLSVAEALTVGTETQQQFFIDALREGAHLNADDVRATILAEKPSVSMAVFPRDRYTGTYTTDLFADESSTYFDDCEEFMRLQEEAVNAKAERYRKKYAFVEVLHEPRPQWWQYREAGKREKGGVVLNLSPMGQVEVRTNVVKTEIRPETAEQLNEPESPKERSPYGPSYWRYISIHRSLIVQAALLRNPRRQKEVAVTLLLTSPLMGSRVRLDVHPSVTAFRDGVPPKAYQVLVDHVCGVLRKCGLLNEDKLEVLWPLTSGHDPGTIMKHLAALTDDELCDLLVFVLVLTFGQEHIERQEPGDTFFSSVHTLLDIQVREWWAPDEIFLSMLRRDELERVAIESGASITLGSLAGYKKKDLVTRLAAYFGRTVTGENLDEHGQKGARWLPPQMALSLATEAT